MDLKKLKAEVVEDPEGVGYSGMTDQEVADSLNAPGNRPGICKPYHISNYFIAVKKDAALEYVNKALNLHALAGRDINFADPDDVGLVSLAMDRLVELNHATTEDKAAVLALGNGRDTASRAHLLGLPLVGPGHIAKVRAN